MQSIKFLTRIKMNVKWSRWISLGVRRRDRDNYESPGISHELHAPAFYLFLSKVIRMGIRRFGTRANGRAADDRDFLLLC